ncbi:hypothetical protein [Idiomarina seosinensis]|uniref:Uncharacterized protein n=1 Tax=Idiomarina seosinensis TaxID=281739 RepID=A0A432ZHK7_9GAMM|nr:hypothetical protein [Idiomarina seosinensis]RUO77507.1 hypothetical protein CWI81_03250 [Idiomarina seosinensis]
MWIHTFTPDQVAEIHHRLHGAAALALDMNELTRLCERVNLNSRRTDTFFNVDAIQVAADYAVTLNKARWAEDKQQAVETAFITALTYLRLSNYLVDCADPVVWHLFTSGGLTHSVFEQILYRVFMRKPLSANNSSYEDLPRERLPLTQLGLDDYRGTARLRGYVDEALNSCCLRAPASDWEASNQEVEADRQFRQQLFMEALEQGIFGS